MECAKAKRTARLRAAGLCASCGREPAIGPWFCPACKSRHREQCRLAGVRIRARRLTAGLCRDCGQPREEGRSYRCAACQKRCAGYSRKSKARKKELLRNAKR